MKYSVLWKKTAEDDLADIWLAADERALISRAARDIDQRLAVNPQSAGESRDEGKRILLVAPLGVTFKVYEQDCVARVIDVWRFREH